jgi:hypothetical protein
MTKNKLLMQAMSTKKPDLTEIYQFRMSKEMKTRIFTLLDQKELDLVHVLRQYLQKILDEEER